MSFARLHKLVAYLAAALGFYALSLGGELDVPVLGAIVLGFLASVFVEGPLLSDSRWIRAWNVALIVVLVLQVTRLVLGGPLLPLLLEFAAFLQVSRLFNRRGAVEYQQIAVLAFLHLIAATVLSTDLGYGLAFLGFVILMPWMLALSHLRREIEGNYPGATEAQSRAVADVRRVLASRRVVGPRFLIGTALLSVPLFLMTAMLFLLFPRVGVGFLSLSGLHGQRVAGFGSNVELGGFGVIRDDPTVVLRVTPVPLPASPPPMLGARLRGTAFDRYDGRRWTRAATRGEPVISVSDEYQIRRWHRSASDRAMQIVLDPLDENVVFLPEGTVSLTIAPRVEAGRDRERTLVRSRGLDVRYTDLDGLGLVYTAWTDPRSPVAEARTLGHHERLDFLAIPPGHERVVALAERVVGDAPSALEKARRIELWLGTTGGFRYTLTQPDTRGRPPLVAFLFDAKAGHCEYFATAMAIMLRAVGVPSRNVTGFAGGRYNPYGGYYAIRQGDAHSWVEAYVEGLGWVTFDPTPRVRADLGLQDGPLSDVDAIIDAIRTRWATRVVGYDLRAQVTLVQRIGEWLARLRPPTPPITTRRGAQSDADGAGSNSVPPWLAGLALALAVAIAVVLARRWRRARVGAENGPLSRPDVRGALAVYRELERSLDKRGRPRPPHATPLEHVASLRAEGFAGADVVDEITRAYVSVRFGGESLPRGEQARLASLARSVRSARRAVPPTAGRGSPPP